MLYFVGMVLPILGRWTLRPFAEYHIFWALYIIKGGSTNDRKGKETGNYRRVW